MKKYRGLKNLALLTLFLFLFQIFLPPVLLSQIGPSPSRPSLANLSVDNLFDEKVPDRQHALIFELIHYTANSFAPREGLRTAAEDLQKNLGKEQFWFSLDIQNPEMAVLLQEANDGRRYLLAESGPMEASIHDEQRSLEKHLMADHEEIARSGIVPDGFMERTKRLSFLYDLQDELWGVKVALLFKISGLSNNINNNYIAEHPEKYVHVQGQINRSTLMLESTLRFAAGHLQQIKVLNDNLAASKEKYISETVSALSEERSNTIALMDVIGKRSASLDQNQSVANARRHAEMLNLINDSLRYRIYRIDNKLGRYGAREAFPNPLYIPPGVGASDKSAEFVDTYRSIARQLIANTNQKVDQLLAIKKAVGDIRRTTSQDRLYFQSFINEIDGIDPGEKQRMMTRSNSFLAEFEASINSIEDNIDQILNFANNLDFERPDIIIGSRTSSSKAFRLNREIEKLFSAGINISEMSAAHDIRHYSLLAGVDAKHFEQLKTYKLLEENSQARGHAIKKFEEKIAALESVAAADARLAEDFKKLGRDILSHSEAFLVGKTQNLSDILDQHTSAAGHPYYDFLSGVNEQLKVRSQVIQFMFSYEEDISPFIDDKTFCIDCGPETTTWFELKEVGSAYADILKKIDNFVDIESYFALEKIQSRNVYTETRALFELSKRLGNEPYLHLNGNSIDVVFTAGSRMAVVKGIGDPQSMDFTYSAFVPDHLIHSPHVGAWGWGAVESFRDDWVKPIANAFYGPASDTLAATADYGGKIVNRSVEMAQNTFESAKAIVDTSGSYISRAVEISTPYAEDFFRKQWEGLKYGAKVVGDFSYNMYRQIIPEDDLVGSLLNVGAYVLSGTKCGLSIAAAIKTFGFATIVAVKACKSFALKLGSDLAKASANTMAMDEYGLLSEDSARQFNRVVDVATLVAVVGINYVDAGGEAWQEKGKLKQGMTLLGIDPEDLSNIENWPDQAWAERVDSLSAYWTTAEYSNEMFQELSGSGGSFTDYMIQSRSYLFPRLGPYAFVYDALSDLSPFSGTGVSASGHGPGVDLPGVAVGPGDGAVLGHSLLPDAVDVSTPVSDAPQHQPSDHENPYKDWENPYSGWENPYKNFRNPYRNR